VWNVDAVDGTDFVDAVEDAIDKSDDDRLEALLCGGVKTLRATRSKPDSALFLALMYLARARPTLFHSEVVVEVFSSLCIDRLIYYRRLLNACDTVTLCNQLKLQLLPAQRPQMFVDLSELWNMCILCFSCFYVLQCFFVC